MTGIACCRSGTAGPTWPDGASLLLLMAGGIRGGVSFHVVTHHPRQRETPSLLFCRGRGEPAREMRFRGQAGQCSCQAGDVADIHQQAGHAVTKYLGQTAYP